MVDAEMHKEWLRTMYDREIDEIRGTISNERLWLKGSDTYIGQIIHEENIENLESYLTKLEKLKEEVNNA